MAELQSAAEAEQRGVEELITDAVRRYLDDRSWSRLLDYGEERAGNLGIQESDVERLIAEYRAEQRNH